MLDVNERRVVVDRPLEVPYRTALASRLISVRDEERRRIARDLHDTIGQQATALRWALERMIQGADPPTVHRVRNAQRMLDTLDRQIDFIVAELRPAALDLGIAAALEQYVSEWSRTCDVAARFEAEGLERVALARDAGMHLYRIAQEALNNVAKHSGAHGVRVVLQSRGHGVVLVVDDDGRGFEPGAESGGGVGIVGMRERAALLGGVLEIESAPGRGTSVTLRVPAG